MSLYYLLATLIILPFASFGLTLLFASSDWLFRSVQWTQLALPEKNTRLYTVLLTFWRVIGAIVLLFSMFFAYIVFIHGK